MIVGALLIAYAAAAGLQARLACSVGLPVPIGHDEIFCEPDTSLHRSHAHILFHVDSELFSDIDQVPTRELSASTALFESVFGQDAMMDSKSPLTVDNAMQVEHLRNIVGDVAVLDDDHVKFNICRRSHAASLSTSLAIEPLLRSGAMVHRMKGTASVPNLYVVSLAGSNLEKCIQEQIILAVSKHASDHFGDRVVIDMVPTANAALDETTETTEVTDDDVERYQVVLWFSIAFVIVLFLAMSSMACMENKRDNLLYTQFNPANAEKKHR